MRGSGILGVSAHHTSRTRGTAFALFFLVSYGHSQEQGLALPPDSQGHWVPL